VSRYRAFPPDEVRYICAWYFVPGMSFRRLARLANVDAKTIRNMVYKENTYAFEQKTTVPLQPV
jgi:glucan biosynthesis protein